MKLLDKVLKAFNIHRNQKLIILINYNYLDECLDILKTLQGYEELLILISTKMPDDIKIAMMDRKQYFKSEYFYKELGRY